MQVCVRQAVLRNGAKKEPRQKLGRQEDDQSMSGESHAVAGEERDVVQRQRGENTRRIEGKP